MRLNNIFTSNMVLQANQPVRFFGAGKGLAKVEFLGQTVCCQNDKEDSWLCEFAPATYGGPYSVVVTLNDKRTVLQDVYVGEVIMVAGQSNIQRTIADSNASEEELYTNENIRCYAVDRPEGVDRANYLISEEGWQICRKEDARRWSAVGYYVGQYLSVQSDHKIGIICCSQGASVIESWIDKEVLQKHQEVQIPLEQKHGDHSAPIWFWNKDGLLYDYMVKKIIPFSMSTVVWYQGESDTTVAEGEIFPLAKGT